MRTTVTIDDALLADVREMTGLQDVGTIVREGMKSLIHREAGRRLARLGGTMPHLEDISRRRFPSE